jgi:hypothetical protein
MHSERISASHEEKSTKIENSMRNQTDLRLLLLSLSMGLFFIPAFAHQPRIVGNLTLIEVRNPDISQAFYAKLNGSPQVYRIVSDQPFRLYVNLLVPALPDIDTDVSAEVFSGSEAPENLLKKLDGPSSVWTKFFERFGGDTYLKGPEYEEPVPAGTYLIKVTSPDNQGKYAVAIGTEEKFPPGEILRTIVVLPKLKKTFFEKSPLTAYFNLSGVFLLVVIAAAGGFLALFLIILKKRRARTRPTG